MHLTIIPNRSLKFLLIVLLAAVMPVLRLNAGTFSILHSFGAPLGNIGVGPSGGLVVGPDGTFYGVDFSAGLFNYGTVYNLGTNGSYALWNFAGTNDGAYPLGDLVLSGNTLYGITEGVGGYGSVFKINTDGTGFAALYDFTNGSDGGSPQGGLALSGATLYGVAASGGTNGLGTIFKVNTDGSGFQVIHTFTARDPVTDTNVDGAEPQGKLLLDGNVLFGTAAAGGDHDAGTIFSLHTDGSAFTNLHSLAISEGAVPYAGVVLSGNKLYGTASEGGSAYQGTIFSLNTDGSAFTNLYSLANGGNDGSDPEGDLLLAGNVLYGTANQDGANGNGTIFSIHTDGTDFTNFYTFTALDPDNGNNYDGANPAAGLILYDGILYGTASGGGPFENGNFGSVFQINTNGSGFEPDDFFDNASSANDGVEPQCPLVASGNTVYGMAYLGGLYGSGCIFKVNADGSGFSLLHSFSGPDGDYPAGGLAVSGGTLYGATSSGGAELTNGEVFSINTDGSGFAILHSFTNGLEGATPMAGVTVGSNVLFGATYGGGTNGVGTVFKMDFTGSNFQTLHSFAPAEGDHPQAPLVLGGNTLYGEAFSGGAGNGSLFRIQTDGSGFSPLRIFSTTTGLGPAGEGANPSGGLILGGTTLYGTTENGGENHTGNIFEISTNGNNYATLFNLDPALSNGQTQTNDTGTTPRAGLCLAGGALYGTAANGGSQGFGTLFEVATNANAFIGFTNLHTFTDGTGYLSPLDGGYPGGGVVLAGGELIGTAGGGGTYAYGVVFADALVPALEITTVGNAPFVHWLYDGESHTLQTTTNLPNGIWSTAPPLNHTDLEDNIGLLLTNRPMPRAGFYRLAQ